MMKNLKHFLNFEKVSHKNINLKQPFKSYHLPESLCTTSSKVFPKVSLSVKAQIPAMTCIPQNAKNGKPT